MIPTRKRLLLLAVSMFGLLLGCATTSTQTSIYFEPSIQRDEVSIRRVAIVPNRLPLNLTDAEEWRRFNWEETAKLFSQRGFGVVDYQTSVTTFERSGLPMEDTQSSRDKYADLAQQLAVDAIVIPYYGTLFESQNFLIMTSMHWIGVATFQIYLAGSNDFFSRIDMTGDTEYITGLGTIFFILGPIVSPTSTEAVEEDLFTGEYGPSGRSVQKLFYMTGAVYMLIDLYFLIRGSKSMWRKSFKKAIHDGLNPFFAAYPAPR